MLLYKQDEVTLGPWFCVDMDRQSRDSTSTQVLRLVPSGWLGVMITFRPRLSLRLERKEGGACLRNGEWSSIKGESSHYYGDS
jgi:hypothetical protein